MYLENSIATGNLIQTQPAITALVSEFFRYSGRLPMNTSRISFIWSSVGCMIVFMLSALQMTLLSFDDARRQLFTGRNVFPSVQPTVISLYPLRYCIETWSNTLEPSSVAMQLVRSKRLSSTTKALTLVLF